MNTPRPILLALLLLSTLLHGDENGTLIFEDDFEREESQEATEELGNGWQSNSEKRAKGDKQVDLKEGTMRIFISPQADHAVSVTHPAEFTDAILPSISFCDSVSDTPKRS